jgi:PilZ domain
MQTSTLQSAPDLPSSCAIYNGIALRQTAIMEEKLSLLRWPFAARAELYPQNAARILTQVKEISLHGCYLEFSPLQKGTHVLVKIFVGSDFFEATATVIFSQPNMGLSLAFREVKPYFSTVLQKWLTQVSKDNKPQS